MKGDEKVKKMIREGFYKMKVASKKSVPCSSTVAASPSLIERTRESRGRLKN